MDIAILKKSEKAQPDKTSGPVPYCSRCGTSLSYLFPEKYNQDSWECSGCGYRVNHASGNYMPTLNARSS